MTLKRRYLVVEVSRKSGMVKRELGHVEACGEVDAYDQARLLARRESAAYFDMRKEGYAK